MKIRQVIYPMLHNHIILNMFERIFCLQINVNWGLYSSLIFIYYKNNSYFYWVKKEKLSKMSKNEFLINVYNISDIQNE